MLRVVLRLLRDHHVVPASKFRLVVSVSVRAMFPISADPIAVPANPAIHRRRTIPNVATTSVVSEPAMAKNFVVLPIPVRANSPHWPNIAPAMATVPLSAAKMTPIVAARVRAKTPVSTFRRGRVAPRMIVDRWKKTLAGGNAPRLHASVCFASKEPCAVVAIA